MKPLEILSAIPKWENATPGQIVDSPAFAMSCRLGETPETLRLGAVEVGDALDLSVLFGDEPHVLRLARSPRFGSHPTKFRLVRFDEKNDPETVAYVHGNSAQLDSMKGSVLTVSGAVYWFKETALPTVFAQEILRSAR